MMSCYKNHSYCVLNLVLILILLIKPDSRSEDKQKRQPEIRLALIVMVYYLRLVHNIIGSPEVRKNDDDDVVL